MNPEKMRTEYGKLVYLLQDAISPEIQEHLEFNCKRMIKTVYELLKEKKRWTQVVRRSTHRYCYHGNYRKQ